MAVVEDFAGLFFKGCGDGEESVGVGVGEGVVDVVLGGRVLLSFFLVRGLEER